MDFISGTYDGESVRIAKVTGTEKEVATFYINSSNQLCVGIKPMSWERTMLVSTGDYTPPEPQPITTSAFRDFAYITSFGAEYSTWTLGANENAHTRMFEIPPFAPDINFSKVRIWLPDITSNPVTPTNIWVALCDDGSQVDPKLGGNSAPFYAATGISATVSGDDTYPGMSPACEYIDLQSTSAARKVCVRLQYPPGSVITRFNEASNPLDKPLGISEARVADDITSDPGVVWGKWQESFGQAPAMILEYAGLSRQVINIAAIGDSHGRGYTTNPGGRGVWDCMRQMWLSGTNYPDISILNLCRAGHGTSAISNRLITFENSPLDIGMWIRQSQSVNDRTNGFDFTTQMISDFRAKLDSDKDFITTKQKEMLVFQGPAMVGLAAGAYARYITLYDTSGYSTKHPYTVRAVDGVITNVSANGDYYDGMSIDGNNHPSNDGYLVWAQSFEPIFRQYLTNLGYEV